MNCALCNKLRESYQRFRQWQLTPTATEPLDGSEQHACLNCGESFDGRYCPRCGQKGNTRRLTLHNVMANALDVWGAGNRSMPRNIVHLLLRPGYMIGDYLRGHRQPYFPPFKMLFIFTATFLIMVEVVRWSIGFEEQPKPSFNKSLHEAIYESLNDGTYMDESKTSNKQAVHDFELRKHLIGDSISKMIDWLDDHRAISIILFQGVVALVVWRFFQHSKRLPQLSLSEQMFVQVFLSSQIMLISAVYFLLSLLWKPGGVDNLPSPIALSIYLFDYKQLFGYSWWGTLWRSAAAMVLLWGIIIGVGIIAFVFVIYPTFAADA